MRHFWTNHGRPNHFAKSFTAMLNRTNLLCLTLHNLQHNSKWSYSAAKHYYNFFYYNYYCFLLDTVMTSNDPPDTDVVYMEDCSDSTTNQTLIHKSWFHKPLYYEYIFEYLNFIGSIYLWIYFCIYFCIYLWIYLCIYLWIYFCILYIFLNIWIS